MENKIYYDYHLKKYPNMQINDKIKLIYQSVLGPTHLISNLEYDKIYNYILYEINNYQTNKNQNVYEWISDEYIRVNLHTYYLLNNDIKELTDQFINSQNASYDIDELKRNLLKYLSANELEDYNYQPVSHSSIYKELYKPSYRVIKANYLNIDLKYSQIKNYLSSFENTRIFALEGRCASGKTTLSKMLEQYYTIIHIDDFFLSINKKTKERLQEVGGNIDYELVKENLDKIIKAIKNNLKKVIIECFNCSTQTYYCKEVELKQHIILEGVYSSHPYFEDLIDSVMFLNVDKKTQLERVSNRALKERFITEWIPLEEMYFSNINILKKADIIV